MSLSIRAITSSILPFLLVFGCSSNPTPSQIQESKKNSFDELATLSGNKNKNELISIILRVATSSYLESNGFGEMREFSIDTNNKSFAFSLDLKGESASLRVAVTKYELQKENGKLFFVAKNIITDKEWINQVAKKYLQERKIEIPSKYSLLLQLVS